MLVQYHELSAELNRIRRFLRALSAPPQTLDQRQFGYVASISAIYASFENFAERTAFQFAQVMLNSADHLQESSLDSLRRRYVDNASVLLAKNLGTGRYQEVSTLDIATSLASCLDDTAVFDVRREVIAHHQANLRWDSLAKLFGWAISDLRMQVARSDVVDQWISTPESIGDARLPEPSDKGVADILDNQLDQLVDRRNEVAHRGIPDDILSPDRLLAVVDYIDVIAMALVSCLGQKLLETTLNAGDSVLLGRISETFQRGRVAIIDPLLHPVRKNDVVWCARNGKARWGQVHEIQLDSVSVDAVELGAGPGIRVDFATAENSELYLWRTPSEVLHPRPPQLFGDKGH